jgi:hypothetical protein
MSKTNNQANWSDFWLGDDFDEDITSQSKRNEWDSGLLDIETIKLASSRKAIANFVSILTNEDIPVHFWTGPTGATNGKVVYLSADILKKEDFDPAVGLSLHEGAHICLTDFELIKTLWARISELYKLGKEIGLSKETVGDFAKLMVNYVEDRFIDDYIFRTAPGYRPYYIALYEKHFNNRDISKFLQSDLLRQPTLPSYEYRIMNLTNPQTDLEALPGLRKIAKELSLRNINRLKTTKDRIKVAVEITKIVFENIKELVNNQKEKGKGKDPDTDNTENKHEVLFDIKPDEENPENRNSEDDVIGGELSEMEYDENKKIKEVKEDGFTKSQLREVKAIIESQKQFLRNHSNISKETITDKQKEILEIIEKSGISLVPVGMELSPSNTPVCPIDCVVVKKMTKELMFSGVFPLCSKDSFRGDFTASQNVKDAVIKGIQLGKSLGKKLQIRQEINTTIYPRRRSGKIYKRHSHEFFTGSESIFYKSHVDKYEKINLHISVDASGSMVDSGKWEKTMTMIVALAKAGSMIDNLRVCISFRTTNRTMPYIVMAYDSTKDKFSKVGNLFPYLNAHGSTPEGLCYEATMDNFVKQIPGEQYYFLTISDGMPCFSYSGRNNQHVSYDSSSGTEHTRKQYKKIIGSGIKGNAYFINSDDFDVCGTSNTARSCFKKMYGKDAKFIDVNNVTAIARTMNDLFLNKG